MNDDIINVIGCLATIILAIVPVILRIGKLSEKLENQIEKTDKLEKSLKNHEIKSDQEFKSIFHAIEEKNNRLLERFETQINNRVEKTDKMYEMMVRKL